MLSFLCCAPQGVASGRVVLNNTAYTIQRLLGEGGFLYVYLVHSPTGSPYALKKIHVPFSSSEEVGEVLPLQHAMQEVYYGNQFLLPYVVRPVAHATVLNADGSTDVYMLLPYYTQLLHDVIAELVLALRPIAEAEVVKLSLGIARGLQAMHQHRAQHDSGEGSELNPFLGDTELTLFSDQPLSHRDLKTANVMLSQTGIPVLVDLGSVQPSRVTPKTRLQALRIQETAATQSTVYYRAPELLEVEVNVPITEKTDVWLFGCVVYAIMYGGLLPFERVEVEEGGNVNLAISMGEFKFLPGNYLETLKSVVRGCLQVEPDERWGLDKVLAVLGGDTEED